MSDAAIELAGPERFVTAGDAPMRILQAVRAVLGPGEGPFPLHEPEIGEREARYVADCVASGWVSTVGPYVDRLEAALGETCGVPHVFATSTGTAALHLALAALGVGGGDEVIVPSLSFVATANAVAYTGATPNFADVETRTLGLDAAKLDAYLAATATVEAYGCMNRQTGRRIAAIVVMHTFGHPADMDTLSEVAARWRIPLVEDAAEALGTLYAGKPAGAHSRVAALSFNGNKIATAGGGGAVLTSDPALAQRLRHLGSTAKQPHRWAYTHDETGFNYRMPSLNAALLLAQVERLDEFVRRKRQLAARYAAAFSAVPDADFICEPRQARANYWLIAVKLAKADSGLRDATLATLIDNGILARPVWTPLHTARMYADCPRDDMSVTDDLALRLINLPSSAKLQERAYE